jgi:hypothetical protein
LSKQHRLEKSDKVFHKIAKGSDKKELVAQHAAEKAIPLDEDGDTDLKEFNS